MALPDVLKDDYFRPKKPPLFIVKYDLTSYKICRIWPPLYRRCLSLNSCQSNSIFIARLFNLSLRIDR